MKYSAIDIANKIIDSTNSEQGETISNLKLQKLLYYVQGFNLAAFGERLFEEDIEAWQYGPVVRSAYYHFRSFGSGSLNLADGTEIVKLSNEEEALFNEVLKEYGQFSAIKLMNFTHEELPWKATFGADPQGVITDDLLIKYFKTQIVD